MGKALQIKKFHRWTILSQDGTTRYMNCICDCGVKKRIRVDSLISGESSSCGCYARESDTGRGSRGGVSKHRLYGVYHDAYRRCFDNRRKDYKHYGGRGITMCKRWSDYESGFGNFLEDMSPSWKEGLELERLDCNGNYEPSNCSWVTRKQQTNNTRINKRLTYKHLTLTASEWSELLSINPKKLKDRVGKLGWSDSEALEYKGNLETTYTLNGVDYKYLKDVIESLGYNPKNHTHFMRKFESGKEGFLKQHNVTTVYKNARTLEEIIKYLKGIDFKPEWETQSTLYIKNKYSFYKGESV